MSNCKQCSFSPCTVAQGASCCMDCYHFKDCSGPCFKAIIMNEERENKMNVKTKKTAAKEITVTRAHQFDDGGITFDMTVGDVTIYGCT